MLGSCTAHALAGAIEYLEKRNWKPFIDVSRLYIYYNTRLREGTVDSDSGAMLRDGIKSLVDYGAVWEGWWPYDVAKFAARPDDRCYAAGLDHRLTAYARLETVDEMRACLAEGYPFVFGFGVYESFVSDAVAVTGIVDLPADTERLLGGHAVLAVGYDDRKQRFLARNSWGTGWGMHGYFTLPYAYLADRFLSDDVWTLRQQGGFS
jgi:C1A family cysteine protease